MIRVQVFDDMTLCTDAEVERMIPLVPEPRRGKALAFRHTLGRFCCLKSYLMLADLLRSEFGIEVFSLSVAPHGKPYLADRADVHFSISHCRNAIAVAVSDSPIGVDAEAFRSFSDGLLNKSMNHSEKTAILGSKEPQEAFASLWTRKEAVFKLLGTGITDNLHDILSDKTATDTVVNHEKGYAVSVAVMGNCFPGQAVWL